MYFHKNLNFLLFIPSLFLVSDFITDWFLVLYSFVFLLLSFVRIPRAFAYLNFVSIYYIFTTVEKRIIPETMVPFLGVILVSKFISDRHEKDKDDYSHFLWLGAFALFSSSLFYLLYSLTFILIIFFQRKDSYFSLKDLWLGLIKYWRAIFFVTGFTLFMFFFFPRVGRFLPGANNIKSGSVGYSTEINNSTISNLNLSNNIAFYAKMEKLESRELLYWRGRTHSSTDGYNWKGNRVLFEKNRLQKKQSLKLIRQQIKYEQDFYGDLIILDHPYRLIETKIRSYRDANGVDFKYYSKGKKGSIVVDSNMFSYVETLGKSNLKSYLKTPGFIPKKLKELLIMLDSSKPMTLIERFRQYVLDEKFSYTLSPGSMLNLSDFLVKKKGFCTHYASLLGLVFRHKGIPSRLVSGFQGGEYNEQGGFYEIRSSDAHAWVEYYDKGAWVRVDPTSFIAPDRVSFGGNSFFNDTYKTKKSQGSGLFNKLNQYLSTLNYQVSLFLDNYDSTVQRRLVKKIWSHYKWALLNLVLGFFLLIYTIKKILVRYRSHPADLLLYKKLKKYKLLFPIKYKTIDELKSAVAHNLEACELIDIWARVRYSKDKNLEELKKYPKL